MDVSIIIVNYKNPPLIVQCVKSILQFEKTVKFEIIVVDNDSQDDTEQQLRAIYPNLKWIQMGYNSGFAKANNAGIRAATGEFVLFLNVDTILVESVLKELIDLFEENKNIGIVGCRLLNADGTLQQSYHDGDMFFKKLWRRNPFVIKLFNATEKNIVDKNQILKEHNYIHNCRWLCGAALMMKRDVLVSEKLYWSEKYFMYWEDVALCYKIREKGYNVLYSPSPSIVHIGGGGSNVSLERFDVLERSKLLCMEDIHGKLYKFLYIFFYKITLRLEHYLMKRKKQCSNLLDKELLFYGLK